MEVTKSAAMFNDIQTLNDLKSSAKQNDDKALVVAAKQFEAIMLQEVLKGVREANRAFESDLFSSDSLEMFEDMYDKQLASELSGGFGFAEMIVKQLSFDQGKYTNNINQTVQSQQTLEDDKS